MHSCVFVKDDESALGAADRSVRQTALHFFINQCTIINCVCDRSVSYITNLKWTVCISNQVDYTSLPGKWTVCTSNQVDYTSLPGSDQSVVTSGSLWSLQWSLQYSVYGHFSGLWSVQWSFQYSVSGHFIDLWSLQYSVCGHFIDLWSLQYSVSGHFIDLWSLQYSVSGHFSIQSAVTSVVTSLSLVTSVFSLQSLQWSLQLSMVTSVFSL